MMTDSSQFNIACRACHGGRFPDLPPGLQAGARGCTPEAAEKLSFWVAGHVQAIHRFDRLSLLEGTSSAERLQFLTTRLNAVVAGFGSGSLRGCRIM